MDPRRIHLVLRPALLALGCAALFTACAHSDSKIKGDQLGRLPAADRQALMDEERAVDVAKANVDASKVALDEAKQFRSIVGEERKAAESSHKAANKEMNLAAKVPNQPYAEEAAKREQIQADNMNALETKAAYADRLVSLREVEVDNREAEQKLTEARLKHAQYTTLAENNLAGDLDSSKLMKEEREAEQNYAKTSQAVKAEQAATDASRSTWNSARQKANAAESASGITDQPITAPRARETLPAPQQQSGNQPAQRKQPSPAAESGAKQGAAQSKELREQQQPGTGQQQSGQGQQQPDDMQQQPIP